MSGPNPLWLASGRGEGALTADRTSALRPQGEPMTSDQFSEVHRTGRAMRRRVLNMAVANNGAYLGQTCSSAETLATIFQTVLNRTAGDVFVLSPAHYCLAMWALMVETGDLPATELETYNIDGSDLEMIGSEHAPGFTFTTGSLSQGLSQAIGFQVGRRHRGQPGHAYVLVSDGELQEGQTWEALMLLAHLGLDSMTVVVDLNDMQVDGDPSGIVGLEPVVNRLQAFVADTVEVDGHDPEAIYDALLAPQERPRVIACRTRIWQGLPSLRERANMHFVRFGTGEAERAKADLDLVEEGSSR